jgi:DNA primase
MRLTEIANPEDQLALWKLMSDKMWAAFGQQAQQQPNPVPKKNNAPSTPKPAPKPVSRNPAKPLGKRKATPVKAHKPKKAPMAPAPKPLPKPQPFQVTPTQASKQQTQQHQQLAHHIHQALTKKSPTQPYPQPIQAKAPGAATVAPMNNSYSERDKDELVMHRRNNPFKPLDIK